MGNHAYAFSAFGDENTTTHNETQKMPRANPARMYKIKKKIKESYKNEAWKCRTLLCLCPFMEGRNNESRLCF